MFSHDALRASTTTIATGVRTEVLHLEGFDIDQSSFYRLTARRAKFGKAAVDAMLARDPSPTELRDFSLLLSHHEQWHIDSYFADIRAGREGKRQEWHVDYISHIEEDRLPIRMSLDVSYTDEGGKPYREQVVALTASDRRMAEGELWVASDHFLYDIHEVMFQLLPRSEAVAVILEPAARAYRGYAISRVIPPGDADRFHVLLAASQSGHYTVRVVFHSDAREPTTSTAIRIYLRRDRNQGIPAAVVDGASFALQDDKLTLGSSGEPLRGFSAEPADD